jgi:multiple antibiotic resistance protein
LLLTALEMMRAKAGARAGGEDTEVNITSIGIVPLGIPLLAGPGAIVTTIVDATALPGIAHKIAISVVILLVAIVVYVALRLSAKAGTYMSSTAMTIFNRVMGLIIASIAIEFMLGGLAARFPILTQTAP